MKPNVLKKGARAAAVSLAFAAISCSAPKEGQNGLPVASQAASVSALAGGNVSFAPGLNNGHGWNNCRDLDGDGYFSGCRQYTQSHRFDCDDSNASVYPGATEICDGVDNQCPGDPGSGVTDEVCSWAERYGDENPDVINAIKETMDGGYIAVGQIMDPAEYGRWFLWVLKLDSEGGAVWERTFSQLGHSVGTAVAESADSGFIVGGYVDQDLVRRAALIAKIDASGEMAWHTSFGASASQRICTVNLYDDSLPYNCELKVYGGEAVKEIYRADNGYLLVTSRPARPSFPGMAEYLLHEVDMNGNVISSQLLPSDGFFAYRAVARLSDGGWVLAGNNIAKVLVSGSSLLPTSADFRIMRLDGSLNILWSKNFGGPEDEQPFAVRETPDMGILTAGITYSWSAGCTDYLLLKLDAAGNQLWHKAYGGEDCEGSRSESEGSLETTSDGGIALLGMTHNWESGERDYHFYKTDSQGNLEWERSFGGPGLDNPTSIRQTSNGEYILSGYKGDSVLEKICARPPSTVCWYPSQIWTDAWAIKLDQNGNCFGPGCADLAAGTFAAKPEPAGY